MTAPGERQLAVPDGLDGERLDSAPLPELWAESHTLARSRYFRKKVVTLRSRRDECADKSGGVAQDASDVRVGY